MLLKNDKHPQFLFLGCCLIFSLLLTACGTNPTTSPGTSTGAGQASGSGSTSTANTNQTATASSAQLPPVLTSCPATGTARAAVMQALTLGSHNNIAYIVNQGSQANPTLGTLKRDDT